MSCTTFTGPEEVSRFVLVTLKSGLKLYAKTGIKPNRAWTPTRMLAKATEFTGVKYRRGEYMKAHDDLAKLLEG